MTNLFFQCSKIVVIASTLIILLARVIGTGRQPSGDLLAYIDNYHNGWQMASLVLYDSVNKLTATVYYSADYGIEFSLNADGGLAYSSNQGGMGEIYVLNTHSDAPEAINITQTPTVLESALNWSPDGRYLAFISYQGEQQSLYIWDGERAINITPVDMPRLAKAYNVAWSHDGRLAFTVTFGYAPEDIPYEVYLWDGNTTTNLSQNPNGADNWPVWSLDGQLAYLSEHDGEYDIYLWDGLSLKDGSPDFNTFTNVEPELTTFISSPTWTNTGSISFLGQNTLNENDQLYVWDGRTSTNLSEDLTRYNSTPRWNIDGRWAYLAIVSSQQLLFVRDTDNHPLLTIPVQYSFSWTPSGNLIFCVENGYEWELVLWNGNEIIPVTRGNIIVAKSGTGASLFCARGE